MLTQLIVPHWATYIARGDAVGARTEVELHGGGLGSGPSEGDMVLVLLLALPPGNGLASQGVACSGRTLH